MRKNYKVLKEYPGSGFHVGEIVTIEELVDFSGRDYQDKWTIRGRGGVEVLSKSPEHYSEFFEEVSENTFRFGNRTLAIVNGLKNGEPMLTLTERTNATRIHFSELQTLYDYIKMLSFPIKIGGYALGSVEFDSGKVHAYHYYPCRIKIGCITGTYKEFLNIYSKLKEEYEKYESSSNRA